ncbi:DUF4252 domain-containing protein [Namhaeicola litoreus]|uniref:DUF4252 domain-containing protein n=1 Tax=Namhaeicola litoreus TaxID=1052145 RepID=A0ABW3Y146_9FLAO
MKTFLFLFAFILLTSCATQTSFNDFYQTNQKEADFSLGLNSSLISSFLSDEEYEEIKPLLKKAKHVRILVFSENSDNMSKKFDKFISKSTFDEMVKIKDDNDKVNVFTLEEKNKIKEVVVEVRSDDDFVLLGLKTNLSEDDIAKLIKD